MRLLSPNNRTKDGGVNDPRENLRHQISEYGKELANKIHEMSKARSDHAKLKLDLQKEIDELYSKRIEAQSETESIIADLKKRIDAMKDEADIKKITLRLTAKEKELDNEISSFMDEKKAFEIMRKEISNGRKALVDYADELEMTNKGLESRHLVIESMEKSLKERLASLEEQENALSSRSNQLDSRIKEFESTVSRETGIIARKQASVDFAEKNVKSAMEAISKEKAYLKDKTRKLDSLIDHYERKKRSK